LWVEPQRQCWGTGDLWDCLMFKVSGTTDTGDKSDKKKAREWEKARSCMRVHIDRRILSGVTFNGAINNINGSMSGGVCNVKSTPKRTNQEKDDDKVQKRTRINEYFQRTPEHQKEQNSMDHYSIPDHEGVIMENVDSEDAYTKNIQLSHENVTEEVHSIIEKIQRIECPLFKYRVVNLSVRDSSDPVNKLTESEKNLLKKIWNSFEPSCEIKKIRLNKWEKVLQPLLKKYQAHFENKSAFDTISLDDAIKDILAVSYTGIFVHKEHFDILWIQDVYKRLSPINLLLDHEQTELSYREDFVNPIIAKVFDDIMDLIRVKTGEIENKLSKNQRNETRQYKQRIQIGCYQDGIYTINVNATIFEIGFLEVVGSAIYVDITKLNEDTEKIFKCMQISIFYQRQHHLQRGAKEQQLTSLESYGIIVYQRTFTIYVMHQNMGIYVVDKLTEFSIPNSKDQLYVLREVIEKVYMYKSRLMEYYLAVQKITPSANTFTTTKDRVTPT
ncbi:1860_t:CDS:10, partial [Ambispora leptoticha]